MATEKSFQTGTFYFCKCHVTFYTLQPKILAKREEKSKSRYSENLLQSNSNYLHYIIIHISSYKEFKD